MAKSSPTKNIECDIVVIGGGPAGMIAAGRAAECGARVVLVEKNDVLGKKLLISGGGRCNLTNTEPDERTFLSAYKEKAKFLFSPFSKFSVKNTLIFFDTLGVATKIETENRVFPTTDSSKTILDALIRYMKTNQVHIIINAPIVRIRDSDNHINEIITEDGLHIKAKKVILATGGTSHPYTGSTGEGFDWLKRLGHTINNSGSSLVPIKIKEEWVHSFQGVSFPDIKMNVLINGVVQFSKKGKLLFTHFGLSGPMVLNASGDISDIFSYNKTTISLNLFPTLDAGAVDRNIQKIFTDNQNKKLKNALGDLVPPKMVPAIISQLNLDPEKEINKVSREERQKITFFLQNMNMTVSGFADQSEAIVASGGVDLNEVDTRTMKSKIIDNLYIVGDMLDINRPSGGYSLQLCWTSGYVAGESAAKK